MWTHSHLCISCTYLSMYLRATHSQWSSSHSTRCYNSHPPGLQFAAHSQVLRLLAPSIDWRAAPLRHLPAAAVRAVLHYLYTGALPERLSPSVAGELRAGLGELPELQPLAELCGRYVTNVTLRDGKCVPAEDAGGVPKGEWWSWLGKGTGPYGNVNWS